jgi:hypothetical protein
MAKAVLSGFGVGLLASDPIKSLAAEALFDQSSTGPVSASGSASGVGSGAGAGQSTGIAPASGSGSGVGGASGARGVIAAASGSASATGSASGTPGVGTVIVAVLAGQSNMDGRSNTPDRVTLDVDQPHCWQFGGYSGDASTYQKIVSDITPMLHYPGFVTAANDRLSPGEYIVRQRALDYPGAEVVGVPVASGGTSLCGAGAPWQPGATVGTSGVLFNNMISQTNLATTAVQTKWPGAAIIYEFYWLQGENDANNGITQAVYVATFTDWATYARTRVTGASTAPIVIGSMIPALWDPTSGQASAGYQTINRAHVQASLTIPGCYYVRGTDSIASSTDTLHYSPASFVREVGIKMAQALTDVTAPSLSGPSTYSNESGRKLSFLLQSPDLHKTYEIVAGTYSSLFELSDPYFLPAIRYAGDGTGPAPGGYPISVRARDGSGNYSAARTYTITVANEVSPASYFSSSERGGVYDWSVLSNLSQTFDGLTPVTAVGQTVRWVRDSSPNNNHLHSLDNSVAAPTLQLNENGKYVLRFPSGGAIMFADVPFFFPGTSNAYTAIGGLKSSPQASIRTILSSGKSDNVFPGLVPFQATTTASIQQAGRNNASGGGTFPVLANIQDNTTRVVTSAYSPNGAQRMRDASLRPSDGTAGSSYTVTSNTSLGLSLDSDRMAIGGACGPTPAAFFVGDLLPFSVISRDLTENEVQMGENWTANRSLAVLLPGQSGSSNVGAAGGVGTASAQAVRIAPAAGNAAGVGAASGGVGGLAPASGSASGSGQSAATPPGSVPQTADGIAGGIGSANGQAVKVASYTGTASGAGTAGATTVAIASASGSASAAGTAGTAPAFIAPASGSSSAAGGTSGRSGAEISSSGNSSGVGTVASAIAAIRLAVAAAAGHSGTSGQSLGVAVALPTVDTFRRTAANDGFTGKQSATFKGGGKK